MKKTVVTILISLLIFFSVSPVIYSLTPSDSTTSEEVVNEELTEEISEETSENTEVEIEMDEEESFSSLQEKYDELEKDINKNSQELNGIQSQINTNNNYLMILNSQVDILNSQIRMLDEDIATSEEAKEIIEKVIKDAAAEIVKIEKEMTELNKELTETEGKLEEAKDELLEYLRDEYISGGDLKTLAVISILLTSETMEEYLVREELLYQIRNKKATKLNNVQQYYTQLTTQKARLDNDKTTLEHDRALIAEYEEQRKANYEKLEADKAALESKKVILTGKKGNIRDIISTLDSNSEVYKEQIKKDREEMEIISAYVDNYISQYSSSLGDVPDVEIENDGQMAWPVNFNSYISAGYPTYSDGSPHWGIDICASNGNSLGRPFNAAQGGTVIIAVNDGNWNHGFGNYCVIDHGDGTSTLYAHANSLVVSVGDKVHKGEHIGYIGATGNVTGPHLHFEVRVKDANGSVKRVNPLLYVNN